MSNLHDAQPFKGVRMTVAEAADLIGNRLHRDDWSPSDPATLECDIDDALDKEAWMRADHVEELLTAYVADGQVTAYGLRDDGVSITPLPIQWTSHPSFSICIRTGRYMVHTDAWDQVWINGPELRTALPPAGQARKKHTFEWDKIIHEGWMFALKQPDIPTKAEIVRHLGAWCPENGQAVPEGSQLAKTARTIVDFLRENKSGWKDFDSKSVEA